MEFTNQLILNTTKKIGKLYRICSWNGWGKKGAFHFGVLRWTIGMILVSVVVVSTNMLALQKYLQLQKIFPESPSR